MTERETEIEARRRIERLRAVERCVPHRGLAHGRGSTRGSRRSAGVTKDGIRTSISRTWWRRRSDATPLRSASAPKRSGGQVAEGDREATHKRPRDATPLEGRLCQGPPKAVRKKRKETPSSPSSPCTPYYPYSPQKGKELMAHVASDPAPDHRAHARATHAREEPAETASHAFACGSGTGSVSDERILYGDDDPVLLALRILRIPRITASRGVRHDNARLFRWSMRIIGEDTFRALLCQKWHETKVDGPARNPAAAFQCELYRLVDEERKARS